MKPRAKYILELARDPLSLQGATALERDTANTMRRDAQRMYRRGYLPTAIKLHCDRLLFNALRQHDQGQAHAGPNSTPPPPAPPGEQGPVRRDDDEGTLPKILQNSEM